MSGGSDGNFVVGAGAEVLEFHPDFGAVANFHDQIVQAARAGAFGVLYLAIEGEAAVVAGAEEMIFRTAIVDEATGVRADDVEGADLVADALEIDGADGHVGRAVPRVDAGGQNRKFSRLAVFRKGVEGGDEDGTAAVRFAAQRIEENKQAGDGRRDGERAADDDGGGFREETAPVFGWCGWWTVGTILRGHTENKAAIVDCKGCMTK